MGKEPNFSTYILRSLKRDNPDKTISKDAMLLLNNIAVEIMHKLVNIAKKQAKTTKVVTYSTLENSSSGILGAFYKEDFELFAKTAVLFQRDFSENKVKKHYISHKLTHKRLIDLSRVCMLNLLLVSFFHLPGCDNI